jgi:hypothetical protein
LFADLSAGFISTVTNLLYRYIHVDHFCVTYCCGVAMFSPQELMSSQAMKQWWTLIASAMET